MRSLGKKRTIQHLLGRVTLWALNIGCAVVTLGLALHLVRTVWMGRPSRRLEPLRVGDSSLAAGATALLAALLVSIALSLAPAGPPHPLHAERYCFPRLS